MTSRIQIQKFGQVHEYKGTKGTLFVVVLGQEKINFQDFQRNYFNSPQSPFNALKETFADFIKNLPHESEVGVVALTETAIYLTARGNFRAVLQRQGSLVTILNSTKDVILTISGKLSSSDKLLFTSSIAINDIGQTEIEEIFITEDLYSLNNSSLLIGSVEEVVLDQGSRLGAKSLLIGFIDRLIALLPQRSLRVHPEEDSKASRRKHLTLVLGIVLFLFLLISVFFGAKRKAFLDQQQGIDDKLTTANQQLEEARSLKDLSKDKARSLLLEARDTALSLSQEHGDEPQVIALKSAIDQSLGEIAGLYKSEANVYLDLSLISSGFEAGKVDLSEGNLLVLDKSGERLVSIDIPSKKTEVVGGPSELNNAIDVAAYTDRNFVLESDGIKEIENSSKLAVAKDWPGEILIKAFAGNIYVLDKPSNAIWRYSGDTVGFGPKSAWLAEGQNYQLDDSRQLMIDGSIWVLDTGGRISKYINGRLDSFNLANIGNIDQFYTDAEAQYLYLLDKSAGRVSITDKKGQFVGEYDAPQIKEANTIVVSEPEKKLLLMSGSKIYSIDLTHLQN